MQTASLSKIRDTEDEHTQRTTLRADLIALEDVHEPMDSVEEAGLKQQKPHGKGQLEAVTAALLQEQQARRTLARYCEMEILRLSQKAALAEEVGTLHTQQITKLQQDMAELNQEQQHFTHCIQQTHALADKVCRNEIRLDELAHHLTELEESFEHRLTVVESRLDLLSEKVENAVRRIKTETVEELLSTLQRHAQHVASALDIPQLDHWYIPLDTQQSQHSSGAPREDLTDVMDQFLFSKEKARVRVCLLLGDAGSGKTVFGLKLQKRIWEKFNPMDTDACIIPFRIEMKRFNQETAKNCVHSTLQNDYHLTDEAIGRLKTSNNQFVFIFDGYDELAGGGMVNLYQTNQLAQWGVNPKVIIGCRSEYLIDQPYRELLGPGGENNNVEVSECHLLPLSIEKISDYLEKRSDKNELEAGSKEKYEDCLKQIPGLAELINTPFLLKIYISAFPLLEGRTTTISRVELYEAFMQAWFKKEEQKLIDSVGPISGDIKKAFLQFSRRLAVAMYENRVNEVSYKPEPANPWEEDSDEDEAVRAARAKLQHENTEKWEQFFSNKEEKTVQTRRGCPLRCVDNTTYAFVHQSFLEYFVADSLWDALITANTKSLAKWGARCLTKEPKVPAVIQFLAERLRTHPKKEDAKKTLYQLIAASKRSRTEDVSPQDKSNIKDAASNAITVLNFGLVALSIKARQTPDFFREIQIPYADLRTAELSGIDFTDADLSYTTLIGAKLNDAVLDHCDLTEIDLKQFPMLKEPNPIKAVAYSQDGRWMAVASGQVIQLYRKSLLYWKPESILQGHKNEVTCVAFAPNSLELASGSLDNTVRIWSLDGTAIRVFKGHKEWVTSVIYFPDSQRLASASKDDTIRLWQSEGASLHVLKGHSRRVTSLAISPDGQMLVSGSKDKSIRLWNTADGKLVRIIAKEIGWVTSIAFAPDGTQVAVGSLDKTVRFFGLDKTVGPVCKGHSEEVTSVVFFPNGKQIASASEDKTIRLWDIEGTAGAVLEGHTQRVTSIALSAKGTDLISGSSDMTLRLWEIDGSLASYSTSTPLLEGHQGLIASVAFSLNGQEIASGSYDQTVRRWGVDGELMRVHNAHTDAITSVAYSRTNQLVSASYDHSIQFWGAEKKPLRVIKSLEGVVTRIAYSPARNQFAWAKDESVELWQPDKAPIPIVVNVSEHRDLHRAATKHTDRTKSVRFSKPVGGHSSGRINCVAISPNGDQLAIGSSDGAVRIKGIDSEVESLFIGHSHDVSSVAFTADGQYLVSGSYDDTVRVWHIDSDTDKVLMGHTDAVTSVACSPENIIASGSYDKTIRLWKIDGSVLYVLKGHKDAVMCLDFSPKGNQ